MQHVDLCRHFPEKVDAIDLRPPSRGDQPERARLPTTPAPGTGHGSTHSPPSTSAATLAAASDCWPGSTCAYTWRVKATELWPRRSDTACGATPSFRRSVA